VISSNSFLGGTYVGTGTVTFTGGAAATVTLPATVAVANNDFGGALRITVSATGVVSLGGVNTHTGPLQLTGGTLRLASATAVTPNANFRMNSGTTLQGSGTFANVLGTGNGQLQIATGATAIGFEGWSTTPGTALTLNFGGAGAVIAVGGTTFPARTINLNSGNTLTANGPVVISNGLNLNGGTVTVNVGTGSQTGNANTAAIDGAISNSTGTGILVKSGPGRLTLTNAANSWTTGSVAVTGGVLALAATSPLTQNVTLQGGSFDPSLRANPFPLVATQTVTINNAASTVIGALSGTGTLTFAGSATTGTAMAAAGGVGGSVSILVTNTAAGTFGTATLSGSLTTTGPTTVAGNANRLVLASPLTPVVSPLNVTGSQVSVSFAAPASPSAYTRVGEFSNIVVSNGNAAAFSPLANIAIAPTDRSVNRASVLVTSGLDLGTYLGGVASFLDLGNNDMIVRGGASSLASLRGLVSTWLATRTTTPLGVGSSVAGVDVAPFTTVGLVENSASGLILFSSFDGVTGLTTSDAIFKYTYVGDTNFDGLLDASDYNAVLNGFTNGLTGWQNGDVNYDGVVNATDWTAFNAAYTWFKAQVSPPTWGNGLGDGGGAGGSIPEPTSLALLAGVIPFVGRRRRR
jgi:autotransporter-associated beta strand protein